MPEIICNTSPLQYLHQLDVLHVLRELVKTITVPPAVQQELETGRQVARTLQLRITGTLGILIDAKRLGIISAVGPFLDQLQSFGFRLAPHTRAAVLNLVSEVEK